MLPHPVTGQPFASPVAARDRLARRPGDAATPRWRGRRRRTTAGRPATSRRARARSTVCSACPRLVRGARTSRSEARVVRRRSPTGVGRSRLGRDHRATRGRDRRARARGQRRQPDRPHVHRRPSGDWLFASLHRIGLATQPTSEPAGDGQVLIDARMVATVRCAPPANKPTRSSGTPARRGSTASWSSSRRRSGSWSRSAPIGWDGTLRSLAGAGSTSRGPSRGSATGPRRLAPTRREATLLGCYHPSQHNTFTGRLTPPMLDDVLATARALADDG